MRFELHSEYIKKNFKLIFLPELLQKDNKDKEERFNKVKAVAVKAKKELDLSKKEVKKKKKDLL